MQVIKKLNNNVVLCTDSNGKELVAFGNGIGYAKLPYEIGLKKIDRTFYNVNEHYLKLLAELPEEVFKASLLIVEKAQIVLNKDISSNVVFSLADHISFAVERMDKAMTISFAYDVEHLYPKELEVAQYGIKCIQKYMKVRLPKSEAIGIALHFINNMERKVDKQEAIDMEEVIDDITDIIETDLDFVVDKSGFNYYRFCTHCRYFVKRINEKKQYKETDHNFYRFFEETYPDVHHCVLEVKGYMLDIYDVNCSEEEILYLMVHVKRLQSNEDCN